MVVFAISTIGLLIVQYQYLRIGLGLASAQFSKNIDKARTSITAELSEYNPLTYSIGRTIEQDTLNLTIGLDSLNGLTQYYLNDYITYQLGIVGIDAPFTYEIYARDSTRYLQSKTTNSKKGDSRTYPIKLQGYLANKLNKELVLELGFADINSYFLYQLNGIILPGLLFLLAIILVVVWLMKSFYGQSKMIVTTNEFINNLTHELKTPVFSIGIAAKLLEDGISIEKKPILDLVKRETVRLKQHIEKVLELASLESGKALLQFSEIDLKPELERICKDFLILCEHEGISFEYQLADGPYYVLAETFHIENAIGNLLDNAKKYAVNPKIRLEVKIVHDQLHIKVADNGPGIAQHELKRVFRKYYRIKNGNGHRVKGYGLGLAYVQRIVRMHRGKIKVTSDMGIGTCFTLIINLLNKKRHV